MFESKVIDNGKFLLPGNAVMPEWVLDRINAFKTGLYIIARDAKTDDKETLEKMTKLLKNFIIPPGVVINKRISKPELANITKQYDKVIHDDAEFTWFIWLLMNAGFLLSTVLPTSIDEDSLTVPDEIKIRRRTATAEYKETGDKYKYLKDIQDIAKEALAYFSKHENAIADFVNSKANGSLDHIQELMVGIGFAINAKGEIIDTITNCLVEGVDQTDYFSNSSQGIQALYAKSSETSKPGYLGKKLSNICERIKLGSIDCGTKNRLLINSTNVEFLESFVGMNFSNTKSGDTKEFQKEDAKQSSGKDLFFRSPYYCRSKGNTYCAKCYSLEYIRNYKLRSGDNIGLYASTGMTGSLVNLTLKKSHIGVSLNQQEVDLIKDLEVQ